MTDIAAEGRRQATKQANREAIVAAAREVFADLGYGAATVRDIVRRTDLATGTFYNYFPDKEAVFRALLEKSARDVREVVRAARRSAPDAEAFVREGFRAYFEFLASDRTMFEIIRRNAADLVKLKVMKQGGLLRTLALVACAGAAGLRVVVGHGFGLTLSTLAEAAVAAVSDTVIDGCEAVGPLKMAGDVVVDPVALEAGVIRVPDTPGLGASIDPDALKRYRVR